MHRALLVLSLALVACDSGNGDRTELERLFDCDTVREITFPSTTSGALSTSDCDYTDDDGTYADYYVFELDAATNVDVFQTSDTIDSFLSLYNASGTELAFDDDSGSDFFGPHDARISRSLAAGVYVIAANSYGVETGPYTLELTTTP
ncbi:MAG TPA: hypothetical protein EYQ24_03605 [Bacteroidetes bacterium]|nr:hypothetical protein [Bacteroidota bacterium]